MLEKPRRTDEAQVETKKKSHIKLVGTPQETHVDDPHDSWDPKQFEEHGKKPMQPISMSGKVEARLGNQEVSRSYKAEIPPYDSVSVTLTNKAKNEKIIEAVREKRQLHNVLLEAERVWGEQKTVERAEKNAQQMENEVREAAMENIKKGREEKVVNEKLEVIKRIAKKQEPYQTAELTKKVAETRRDETQPDKKINQTAKYKTQPDTKKRGGWWQSAASAFTETTKAMLAALAIGGTIAAKDVPEKVEEPIIPGAGAAETQRGEIGLIRQIEEWAEKYAEGALSPGPIEGSFKEGDALEKGNVWDRPFIVQKGKPWGWHEIADRLDSAGIINKSMDKKETTRIISTYVNEFNKLGKKGLIERGVQSGDFDKIQPGEHIDLSPLKNVIIYKTPGYSTKS